MLNLIQKLLINGHNELKRGCIFSILTNRNDDKDYLHFEGTHQESTASAHELTFADEDQ